MRPTFSDPVYKGLNIDLPQLVEKSWYDKVGLVDHEVIDIHPQGKKEMDGAQNVQHILVP